MRSSTLQLSLRTPLPAVTLIRTVSMPGVAPGTHSLLTLKGVSGGWQLIVAESVADFFRSGFRSDVQKHVAVTLLGSDALSSALHVAPCPPGPPAKGPTVVFAAICANAPPDISGPNAELLSCKVHENTLCVPSFFTK